MKNSFSVVRILFDMLLLTEFKIISLKGNEFSSLSYRCQWGPVRYPSSKTCAEKRCIYEGFIIPGTNQLVCFHSTRKSAITRLKGEKTIQCGYKTHSSKRPCSPIITCENLTDEECSEKCERYTVYVSKREKRRVEVSHCGEASQIEPRKRTLDGSGNYYYVTREDGSLNAVFNCSCGFGEEGTEVQETQMIRRRHIPNRDAPDKMVVSCPIIFHEYYKDKCREKCVNLNGMYSREDNKFICFHSERNVEMIDATAGHCLCGVALNARKKLYYHDGLCPPERKIVLNNNTFDCPKRCAYYKAYVFSPSIFQPNTVYCEYPSYIFKSLSYEIGKTVAIDNDYGSRKYHKFECFCGLRLPKSEIDSKIKFGEFDESFSINDGPSNVKNNSERDISDIHFNEKEVGDLQLSAEFDIIENEEINDLLKDSDFLHDSIEDETTLNSDNTFAFEIPIVGEKRTSRGVYSPDDEIDRGKKRVTVSNIDGSVLPADYRIPSTSCHHAASPNEHFSPRGGSTSHNVGLIHNLGVGPWVSQDRGLLGNVTSQYMGFGRDTSQSIGVGPDVPQNTGLLGNVTSQYMGFGRDTSLSIGVGPDVSQNRGLIRNNMSPNLGVGPSVSQNRGYYIRNITSQYVGPSCNTSQSIGVGTTDVSQNRRPIRNYTSPNIEIVHPNTTRGYNYHNSVRDFSAGIRYPFFRYEDNLSHRSFRDSSTFFLPNSMMTINEPVGGNTSGSQNIQNTGHSRDMSQNMEHVPNTTLEMGADSSMPQNRAIINPNLSRRNEDTFRAIPAGTLSSFLDEGHIMSPSSFPDSPSFLFPNATMEINEILRPGRE